MRQEEQSARRRLTTVTIDQAISGSSNVLIAIIAARLLGVEAFGLFGIVFIVYVTAIGAARSLICEPLLVHPEEAESRPGDAIGAGALLGVGVGTLVGLSGLAAAAWDDRLSGALLVLGACMPLLVIQDLGRYLGFAVRRASMSVKLDLVWLGLMVLGVVGLVVTGAESLAWLTVVWAGSGAIAGALLLWRYRGRAIQFSLSWLRESWMFSWRYLLSFIFTQGGVLVATIALTAIAGARELGGVRGVLLLMSVAMTLQIGAGSAGVADISRMNDRAGVLARARRTAAITAVAALLNGAILLLLPDSWGRLVLGDTWGSAEPLLVPVILQVALQGAFLGGRVGLLGTRSIKTTLKVDLLWTPVLVAASIVGSYVGGGLGYCWSIVIAMAIVTCIWWSLLLRRLGSFGENDLGTPPITQGERQ